MIEKTLAKLGFSPSEIKIYIHLLKSGSSYANKISSETKLNRTNVYEALDRLVAKGIVSFILKNKVKWFEAKSPDSLILIVQEKEESVNELRKDVFSSVKELNKSMNSEKKPLEASIFVGRKGLRMLLEEMLQEKKPISLLGAYELKFRNYFGPYFELWHRQRVKKGIKQRSIFPKQMKNKLERFRTKLSKLFGNPLIVYKYVDNKFLNPTATFIFGNNCIFIQWSEEPIAIKIQNKEIARSHLNYFNLLWNS